ncbi:hypothetical protein Ocin01_13799 [Orchesella cincta]|uniref:Uncharacterized protein n=1 Tax=Orchesella cincta TaxID=48709 RepID=A0A1D2MIT6_ORCCI|nr:hypothetical protein Ocin01_13799 [Orchesella cincta]
MKKFDGTKRAAATTVTKKSSGTGKQKKTQKVSEEPTPAHACLIRAKLQNRKIATL